MKAKTTLLKSIAALAAVSVISLSMAGTSVAGLLDASGMQITEWMYKGGIGEFVEFTNMGPAPIDMTGWYWSDSTYTTPHVAMSGIGVVAVGESVIYTETAPATFRLAWGLSSDVQIWGPNETDNIGSSDAIRIYNGRPGVGQMVDELVFGSSPKTDGRSATIPVADLALRSASSSWTLASAGDSYGSWYASGAYGNPGYYYAAPVPEPGTRALLATGLFGLLASAWRKRK